jgi:hypothetical protein
VHPSFNIHSGQGSAASEQLFVYAGSNGISAITLDADNKRFNDIVCYYFDDSLGHEALATLYKTVLAEEPLFKGNYRKTDLVYTFTESILTPHEVYNSLSNTTMLETVFGDLNPATVKSEFVYTHNLHNIYRVPQAISNITGQQFPFANYSHLYSLMAACYKEDGLFVCFHPKQFTVLMRVSGKLKLVQTFHYNTPEDAAYHLLNVCSHFGPETYNTTLLLSGTINEDSALYAELYKYFLNIAFAGLPEGFQYPAAMNEFPAHYFSHLVSLSACV